ncbi:MAG TPA: sugar ABC transporter permease [Gammaproteobacteria bacterium]|nr:sugar ABC transporter permease [Gammaproteobacteria bacterium]
MAAPALAGLVLFVALPFLLAVGLSLTNLRLGSPLPVTFAGLEQYQRIFGDEGFRRALLNNAVFAFLAVPLQTTLALILALLLNRPFRGLAVVRTLFFMPVVFPMSLVAVVWVLIYAPGPNGMMNALLSFITLGAWAPRDFLHDPLWAFPAIMLLSVWQGMGFQMVILLAGLQAIPAALYEAAAMDGAGRWHQFRYVTLPQLRNPLVFVTLVTMILAFRLFDQVQIMTQGGPNDATATVMLKAVQAAFERQQVARASAMTVVFFVIVLAITWVQRRLVRHEREMD